MYRNWVAVIIGLLLLILVIVWGARSGSPDPMSTPSADNRTSATGTASTVPTSNLPTIAYDQLPPEAQRTLALIAKGGPYPYRQDGVTFQNRERGLPIQPRGYYKEFTVVTPGSKDRGARRVIKARDGTVFYTDDHYESFRRIKR
ncbi:hypothetical protein VV02_10050 [Luteipulveratus mongoliensis]|uniref:Uncharacterized protein n=1 Tax=Luteipulveratus mongoliensis TaxID=571913 RepID=A0A0K1JQD5_9MICO|nr:hypothetical protein VV02_10050 [Luteipulveratus mongoliensis]